MEALNLSNESDKEKWYDYIYDGLEEDIYGRPSEDKEASEKKEKAERSDSFSTANQETNLVTPILKTVEIPEEVIEKYDQVHKENEILRRRISELFKTAKVEMERKDRQVIELTKKLDDVLLKRNRPLEQNNRTTHTHYDKRKRFPSGSPVKSGTYHKKPHLEIIKNDCSSVKHLNISEKDYSDRLSQENYDKGFGYDNDQNDQPFCQSLNRESTNKAEVKIKHPNLFSARMRNKEKTNHDRKDTKIIVRNTVSQSIIGIQEDVTINNKNNSQVEQSIIGIQENVTIDNKNNSQVETSTISKQTFAREDDSCCNTEIIGSNEIRLVSKTVDSALKDPRMIMSSESNSNNIQSIEDSVSLLSLENYINLPIARQRAKPLDENHTLIATESQIKEVNPRSLNQRRKSMSNSIEEEKLNNNIKEQVLANEHIKLIPNSLFDKERKHADNTSEAKNQQSNDRSSVSGANTEKLTEDIRNIESSNERKITTKCLSTIRIPKKFDKKDRDTRDILSDLHEEVDGSLRSTMQKEMGARCNDILKSCEADLEKGMNKNPKSRERSKSGNRPEKRDRSRDKDKNREERCLGKEKSRCTHEIRKDDKHDSKKYERGRSRVETFRDNKYSRSKSEHHHEKDTKYRDHRSRERGRSRDAKRGDNLKLNRDKSRNKGETESKRDRSNYRYKSLKDPKVDHLRSDDNRSRSGSNESRKHDEKSRERSKSREKQKRLEDLKGLRSVDRARSDSSKGTREKRDRSKSREREKRYRDSRFDDIRSKDKENRSSSNEGRGQEIKTRTRDRDRSKSSERRKDSRDPKVHNLRSEDSRSRSGSRESKEKIENIRKNVKISINEYKSKKPEKLNNMEKKTISKKPMSSKETSGFKFESKDMKGKSYDNESKTSKYRASRRSTSKSKKAFNVEKMVKKLCESELDRSSSWLSSEDEDSIDQVLALYNKDLEHFSDESSNHSKTDVLLKNKDPEDLLKIKERLLAQLTNDDSLEEGEIIDDEEKPDESPKNSHVVKSRVEKVSRSDKVIEKNDPNSNANKIETHQEEVCKTVDATEQENKSEELNLKDIPTNDEDILKMDENYFDSEIEVKENKFTKVTEMFTDNSQMEVQMAPSKINIISHMIFRNSEPVKLEEPLLDAQNTTHHTESTKNVGTKINSVEIAPGMSVEVDVKHGKITESSNESMDTETHNQDLNVSPNLSINLDTSTSSANESSFDRSKRRIRPTLVGPVTSSKLKRNIKPESKKAFSPQFIGSIVPILDNRAISDFTDLLKVAEKVEIEASMSSDKNETLKTDKACEEGEIIKTTESFKEENNIRNGMHCEKNETVEVDPYLEKKASFQTDKLAQNVDKEENTIQINVEKEDFVKKEEQIKKGTEHIRERKISLSLKSSDPENATEHSGKLSSEKSDQRKISLSLKSSSESEVEIKRVPRKLPIKKIRPVTLEPVDDFAGGSINSFKKNTQLQDSLQSPGNDHLNEMVKKLPGTSDEITETKSDSKRLSKERDISDKTIHVRDTLDPFDKNQLNKIDNKFAEKSKPVSKSKEREIKNSEKMEKKKHSTISPKKVMNKKCSQNLDTIKPQCHVEPFEKKLLEKSKRTSKSKEREIIRSSSKNSKTKGESEGITEEKQNAKKTNEKSGLISNETSKRKGKSCDRELHVSLDKLDNKPDSKKLPVRRKSCSDKQLALKKNRNLIDRPKDPIIPKVPETIQKKSGKNFNFIKETCLEPEQQKTLPKLTEKNTTQLQNVFTEMKAAERAEMPSPKNICDPSELTIKLVRSRHDSNSFEISTDDEKGFSERVPNPEPNIDLNLHPKTAEDQNLNKNNNKDGLDEKNNSSHIISVNKNNKVSRGKVMENLKKEILGDRGLPFNESSVSMDDSSASKSPKITTRNPSRGKMMDLLKKEVFNNQSLPIEEENVIERHSIIEKSETEVDATVAIAETTYLKESIDVKLVDIFKNDEHARKLGNKNISKGKYMIRIHHTEDSFVKTDSKEFDNDVKADSNEFDNEEIDRKEDTKLSFNNSKVLTNKSFSIGKRIDNHMMEILKNQSDLGMESDSSSDLEGTSPNNKLDELQNTNIQNKTPCKKRPEELVEDDVRHYSMPTIDSNSPLKKTPVKTCNGMSQLGSNSSIKRRSAEARMIIIFGEDITLDSCDTKASEGDKAVLVSNDDNHFKEPSAITTAAQTPLWKQMELSDDSSTEMSELSLSYENLTETQPKEDTNAPTVANKPMTFDDILHQSLGKNSPKICKKPDELNAEKISQILAEEIKLKNPLQIEKTKPSPKKSKSLKRKAKDSPEEIGPKRKIKFPSIKLINPTRKSPRTKTIKKIIDESLEEPRNSKGSKTSGRKTPVDEKSDNPKATPRRKKAAAAEKTDPDNISTEDGLKSHENDDITPVIRRRNSRSLSPGKNNKNICKTSANSTPVNTSKGNLSRRSTSGKNNKRVGGRSVKSLDETFEEEKKKPPKNEEADEQVKKVASSSPLANFENMLIEKQPATVELTHEGQIPSFPVLHLEEMTFGGEFHNKSLLNFVDAINVTNSNFNLLKECNVEDAKTSEQPNMFTFTNYLNSTKLPTSTPIRVSKTQRCINFENAQNQNVEQPKALAVPVVPNSKGNNQNSGASSSKEIQSSSTEKHNGESNTSKKPVDEGHMPTITTSSEGQNSSVENHSSETNISKNSQLTPRHESSADVSSENNCSSAERKRKIMSYTFGVPIKRSRTRRPVVEFVD